MILLPQDNIPDDKINYFLEFTSIISTDDTLLKLMMLFGLFH